MTSGLDGPVRTTEVDSAASPSLEAASFQSSLTPRSSGPEPEVLVFGSPFENREQSATDQTLIAQAPTGDQQRAAAQNPLWDSSRPGWDQPQNQKRAPATEKRTGEQTPPKAGWGEIQRLWDQMPRPADQQRGEQQQGPRFRKPPWDSTRPAWDQEPAERPRQTDGRDTPPRHRPPGNIHVGSDQYRLSDRVDARTMRQIPDAKVFVNPGFDPSKPINLIVYNHGWNDTVDSAFRNAQLQEQMAQAPPNSMLVIPAWQARDGAASGAEDARFKNNFVGMLDAAVRTSGRTLDDVSRISFVSHSAGYNAIDRELNALSRTALYDKVATVANLDTNYETRQPAVDAWIAHNVRNGNFANGRAAFLNLWSSETNSSSRGQAARIADLVLRSGIPRSNSLMGIDYGDRRRTPISPGELSNASIVFQHTKDDHANLPNRFFGHAISKLRR